ncbi:protein TolR [Thiococcus pfennigii]|jgi:biopolymer transport protein TolR|uniref:protein TolR n=1 Tax=Thiococcus pfennigii TaxID=1057 RepID=UPI001907C37F|nr:protein TolR [Thiococcus pfennigii]MBK1702660.1 protein TolR [Thiococcus pfennigii]MBK1732236.1 protein TolR [Thiococcus pfennigii]
MPLKHARNRRRLMAEINVVPYIDVMLVLLVIFMVTAPLITQGVKVDLPEARARIIAGETSRPALITVDQFGDLYLDAGDRGSEPVDERQLFSRLRAILDERPGTPVMVSGDNQVDYGRVVAAMVVAQAAGAPQVGLITRAPEPGER